MYKAKNILLTGGCGFIGSSVINYLLKKDKDIYIFNIDKIDYCSSEKNVVERSSNRYKFIKGDIRSTDLIRFLLKEYKIDTIMHFAAQSHVDNSFGNSIQFTYDNVLGTHTLLECSKVYGKIKRFIHVSTDEVYGESELNENDKVENAILNPTNPYAATKAAAEFIVKAYAKSFNIPIIITRGNNVYGPRQYPEKLIPRFSKHLLEGIKCPIHGNGETRRNFIYVDDVASAFHKILCNGKLNEIYNIGTKDEYSVLDILRLLVKKIKGDDNYLQYGDFVPDRDFNDFRYAIEVNKLSSLGWKQEVNFEEGINKTIEWYRTVSKDHW